MTGRSSKTAGKTPPPERGIFCNRTLNLRAIGAIGYDMDYTLVHYRVHRWEGKAYDYIKEKLQEENWPVEPLRYQPDLMVRGLIIDRELGNIVKADRFGYVKYAFHGTKPMGFAQQRSSYARILIDLNEPRFKFLNTLFSMSEACIFAQLVDLLDKKDLPGVLGYSDLYSIIRNALDEAHLEGQLKRDIIGDPDNFVEPDPDTPLALLDQKIAGKKLVLITNSEWPFTNSMLSYCFEPHLPDGMRWRDLFDIVIASARKPSFFSADNPAFEVVNDDGLLKPATMGLRANRIYVGGNAGLVEEQLNLSGDQILYVGDHIWADVKISKALLRWRTAAVLRELEADIAATEEFKHDQIELDRLMNQKERLERKQSQLRLRIQRRRKNYLGQKRTTTGLKPLDKELNEIRMQLEKLDSQIAPIATRAGRLSNPHWGLLMRAGNDKSHMARQVEQSADIYLSRVSNFLYITPYAYLRSRGGSLPHDRSSKV